MAKTPLGSFFWAAIAQAFNSSKDAAQRHIDATLPRHRDVDGDQTQECTCGDHVQFAVDPPGAENRRIYAINVDDAASR